MVSGGRTISDHWPAGALTLHWPPNLCWHGDLDFRQLASVADGLAWVPSRSILAAAIALICSTIPLSLQHLFLLSTLHHRSIHWIYRVLLAHHPKQLLAWPHLIGCVQHRWLPSVPLLLAANHQQIVTHQATASDVYAHK